MSPREASGAEGSHAARSWVTAILLVAIAVGMMFLMRARPAAPPFDPRSGTSTGTRGLVVLLRKEGASVDIVSSPPAAGADRRVIVFEDRLTQGQRDGLMRFVKAGGVVVMADPNSPFVGPPATAGSITGSRSPVRDLEAEIDVPRDECGIPALAHLRGLFVRTGVRFVAGDQRHCFSTADGSFVVVRPHGKGLVVQLGDNELFTNALLGDADNGPLAAALLAPVRGSKVSVLVGDGPAAATADVGSGDEQTTLSDLVRPGVWMAFAQLAIAFLVFAVAKAIRPGRPVREPDQVPVAGSELVVATGRMMQRARHAGRAAVTLQSDAHRTWCEQFHLPQSTDVAALDDVVVARAGVAPGRVMEVLMRPVPDQDALLRLGNDIANLRHDIALEGATQ